ncbi:glycosyltransferase [Pseudoalteromonas sp. EB27]|uniref:glycosyltransferase n=1 Tax=Pseudoalteromonas sp. EB27 TaxID=1938368 RepID=UPI0009761B83|nr:glycosyltransferase [Pseudoalteromonas sp. EB27]
MKKISFVVSNLGGGGTQRVTTALANEFFKNGYIVDVLVCYSGLEKKFNVAEGVNIIDVRFEEKKSKYLIGRCFDYIKNLIRLRQAITKSKPTIIIAQQFEQCIRVPLSLLFYKKKLICCEHSEYGRLTGFTRAFVNLYYKFLVRNLVVLTQEDKYSYPSYLNNIQVIGNPLCVEASSVKAVPKRLGGNVILSVGRLSKEKGFYEYICFIVDNKSIFKNWNVNIVGSGSESDRLHELIKSSGIGDIVTITPFSENIELFYRSADIYYLPSIKEGFGLVLLEAMEYGLPIISNNSSKGARALIINDFNGLMVSDTKEMINAFSSLMKSNKKRQELSLNATLFVKNYYIDNVIKDWEKLFINYRKSWF